MSIPSLVPVFDMDAFEGISFEQAFQLEVLNPDGSHQNPIVYFDLTGKTILFIINGIFTDPLILTADAGANVSGSIMSTGINGQFQFMLSSVEMARVKHTIGYHHILSRESGQEDQVLLRGTFRVIPFNAEGAL